MKLVVDMKLSPTWSNKLVGHGFEAVHWSAIDASTTPDDEILSWAREQGFVVVTNDSTSRPLFPPRPDWRPVWDSSECET
jgi:predicted nuclease of predicted toxin-antitoxin system